MRDGPFGPPAEENDEPDGQREDDSTIGNGPRLRRRVGDELGVFLQKSRAEVAAEEGGAGHAEDFSEDEDADRDGWAECGRKGFLKKKNGADANEPDEESAQRGVPEENPENAMELAIAALEKGGAMIEGHRADEVSHRER